MGWILFLWNPYVKGLSPPTSEYDVLEGKVFEDKIKDNEVLGVGLNPGWLVSL